MRSRPRPITRFTRNQVIQTGAAGRAGLRRLPVHQHGADVLLRAAHRELVVGAARAGRVGADVCRCGRWRCGPAPTGWCASEPDDHAGGQHVRRDHHPGGRRRPRAEREISCRRAASAPMRATAAVALQQSVQVITHIGLLIFFSAAAGASANLSHFVPQRHGAVPDRRGGARPRRHVPVRAQAAALAGHGGAAPAQGARRPTSSSWPANPSGWR